ncbi:ribosome small subunit-dependent GTPase A [Weissella sagaensis]|jgi:ribosome biogenesis GTPase|uniref:Small ribosomal subunit biogenesis GTPase RsgA n=1 Tax=Weissella sagaensis TaxID=2559928 RepID=A0ABW1RT36_9LACO|nr:ribosome small subunit-dependent GTPase A [Weissella sagaensis]KAA8432855.1 ribosome small subunit-dependent GTPase A [Weissella paramesenteroides]MBU7568324.1 ribosome small subunit-dependent GTPase A [Weissella hellenica]KAA8437959.1 ribosome small subunit-dependent GTPase A [Weissella paramesenteroides]QDJ59142.1 ribosome small subunit-dependent GTPase A [Weissella hellenica]QEA56433.1 ribosome small subunit-dependent GTPase A [Weissella hellenica]
MAEYHGQIQLALAGFYDVLTAEGTLFRTRARGNFRKKDLKPLVGDWVTFSAQTSKEGYILAIDQRRNSIVRPPVANVDQVIVVTAVKMPDWSSNLLDRQLVALEEKNIEPVIYFTKTDLLTKAEMASFADIVAGYREIGYQVVWPDEAFDQTSLKTVKKLLADKLTVLMGQTGAGKSTLLNHLSPELNLATGEVSQALSRGKHTTRQVSLIELYGGLVADTPGFSAFEVFDMPARELGQYFRELNDYARNCRFRGCVHLNEPNCAVKEAVSQGKIMASRYDNYKLFYDLIAGRRPVYNKHDKKH